MNIFKRPQKGVKITISTFLHIPAFFTVLFSLTAQIWYVQVTWILLFVYIIHKCHILHGIPYLNIQMLKYIS